MINIDEMPDEVSVLEEGLHDAKLNNIIFGQSKQGKDMLTAEFMIDNGPKRGAFFTEYFSVQDKQGFGMVKLKNFLKNSTFTETQFASWDVLCKALNEKHVRVALNVVHEYKKKDKDGNWKTITRQEYAGLEKDSFIKSVVVGFAPVQAEPDQDEHTMAAAGFPDQDGDIPF